MAEINLPQNEVSASDPEIPRVPGEVSGSGIKVKNEGLGKEIVAEVTALSKNNTGVDLGPELDEISQLQVQLASLFVPSGETPKLPNAHKKSPQELASQMNDVFSTGLGYALPDSGLELDVKYKAGRDSVRGLLERKASDEELALELIRLYEEGVDLGIYSPAQGGSSEEHIEEQKKKLLGFGFSEEEASQLAVKKLEKSGYLASVRGKRREYEKQITEKFSKYVDTHPISADQEKLRIEQLRERVIVIDNPEHADISSSFPGGNFLYHGTRVDRAISILDSGGLINYKALRERQSKQMENGEDSGFISSNSGYEGISFNFNEITAMPGDRYHMVGFLISPDAVLNGETQLAIPSRPAPNELILIDGEIDADRFYNAKSQLEMVAYVGMGGESNSVLNNVISLTSTLQAESETRQVFSEPMLRSFSKSNMTDIEMEEALKGMYSTSETGLVEFSPDLLQQIGDEIPVAAVWFQALIDTGRVSEIPGMEGVKTVREFINKINGDSFADFIPAIKALEKGNEMKVADDDEKVDEITVPISELYMMIPDNDLEEWLPVLARTKTPPRGILVYNHNNVRLENFASDHRGDDEAMTAEVRKLVPVSDRTIDYDSQVLGEEITPDKLAGFKRHVIAERYLKHRKSLKKDASGKVMIV